MTSIALEAPITLDEDRAATNGYRPIDTRVTRAADELGLGTRTIERLPFDLSVLESGGVFIVRRATCG